MRRGRHLALGAALGVAMLGSVGAGSAAARPWTADYQWQNDARTGYENWVPEEAVPGSGAAGPFYRTSLGGAPAAIGRGLAFEPLGGRVYDNGDPTKETGGPGSIVRWRPPGASTISSATFSQLRYRNEGDGQYLRVRVSGRSPGETDAATDDYGPVYGQDSPTTTYTLPNRTFQTPAGLSAEAWLFTICGGNPAAPGTFACPDVAADSGTFARVGGVRLTLDDPDDPAVDIASSSDIGDGYVNKRRTQRLSITAKDPSSGIARIRVQVASGAGGGGRTLVDRRIACDPDHRTAGRGGLVCPETATATATDPASAQGKTARTYTITTTDYAGNVTTTTRTLRLDTTAPDAGSLSGELKGLLDGWTNRRGTVAATVRATDGLSGVGKVEVLAQRVASGRSTVLGSATPACDQGCRTVAPGLTADLDRITRDGRYRLQVRVTDRAGNAKTFKVAAPLKVDRTAPRKIGPDPFYRVLGNGRIRVYVPAGRDAPDGAGLGNYVVRYFTKGDPTVAPMSLLRFARVQAEKARIVRYKKQRYRTLDISDVDTLQPVEGPSTACDAARYGTPSADLGGEVGNCPRVVTLKAAATAEALPYARYEGVARVVRAVGSRTIVGFVGFLVLDRLISESLKNTVDSLDDYPRCGLDCRIIAESSRRLARTTTETMRGLNAKLQGGISETARQTSAAIKADLDAIAGLEFNIRSLVRNQKSLIAAGVASGALVDGAEELRDQIEQLKIALIGTASLLAELTAEKDFRPGRRNKKGQKCWNPGSVWRRFTDGNRRWNLCVLSKRRKLYTATTKAGTGTIVKAYEAHHLFPRKLEDDFARAGIRNVNLPAFLCWQRFKQHQSAKNAYNRAWETVFDRITSRPGRRGLRYGDRPELLRVATQFATGVRGPQYTCRPSFAVDVARTVGMRWGFGVGL